MPAVSGGAVSPSRCGAPSPGSRDREAGGAQDPGPACLPTPRHGAPRACGRSPPGTLALLPFAPLSPGGPLRPGRPGSPWKGLEKSASCSSDASSGAGPRRGWGRALPLPRLWSRSPRVGTHGPLPGLRGPLPGLRGQGLSAGRLGPVLQAGRRPPGRWRPPLLWPARHLGQAAYLGALISWLARAAGFPHVTIRALQEGRGLCWGSDRELCLHFPRGVRAS